MEPIFTDTSMDWSKPAAYEAYKSLRRARNSWPNNTEGPTEAREWQDPEMLGLDISQDIVPENAPVRLGLPVEFRAGPKQVRPNARKQQETLDSMASTRNASRSRFEIRPQQTLEEARLLGSYGRYDADAVPIRPPMTSGYKIRNSGGPKPQNNLSRQPHQTGPRYIPSATHKPKGGIQNKLQIETRRGDNVGAMLHATMPEHGYGIHISKRQKTGHYTSSPTSGTSADEVLDHLGPHGISFGSSQLASRAPSAHSQETTSPMKRTGSSTGNLTEYKSVEQMMNSDLVPKKRQRRINGQNQYHSRDLPSSSPRISTASQPIDISGDDDMDIMDPEPTVTLPKPMYKGTIRVRPSETIDAMTSKSLYSPFFHNDASSKGPSNDQRKPTSTQSNDPKRMIDQSARLDKQFVSITGSRRGSGFHLSSDRDELDQTGNTVRPIAHVRASSPTKQARQNSPSKESISTRKPASNIEQPVGMEPSNIKSSTFVSPKPKDSSGVRNTGTRSRSGEAAAPLGFELAAISVGGELLDESDFGFVRDTAKGYYGVQRNGQWVRAQNSSLQIDPEKLISIDFGTSGGKVRFTSSRSDKEDHILDFEFRKEKDAAAIIKRLSNGPSCKVISHERERMDKIFEKRRTDIQRQHHNDCDTSILQEVQIPAPRHEIPGPGNAKPQRKSAGLVDELMDRTTQGNGNTGSLRTGGSRLTGNGQGIKAPRELIKQPAHNNHLRRSSRTSGATSKLLRDPFDAYDDVPGGFLDDAPQYEKFSQVHGLGDVWNKPLTYPKVGKKKVTVEWSDLERLDEGEFLNDNLIGFYLRYLEQTFEEKSPDLAKRVYFFNTYFYATLTNAHKPKRSFNYEGVQKWTKSVDIFTYDYIIVPINEHSHWYLAIICNLPHLDRVVMPEEASNSQTELASSKTREERNEFAASPSSPIGGLGQRESTTSKGDDHEPDERDARNSFAEMSLDNDVHMTAAYHADLEKPMIAAESGNQDIQKESKQGRAKKDENVSSGTSTPQPALDLPSPHGDMLDGLEAQLNRDLPSEIPDSQPLYPLVIIPDLATVRKTTTKMQKSVGLQFDDQEMLDSQLKATSPGRKVSKESDNSLPDPAKQRAEDFYDFIEDIEQPAKVSAKNKKQKRKSMPPPVTLIDPSNTAIITFDSLGQTRSLTTKTLKQYLREEAKSKRGGMEVDTAQIKGINAKVPLQENFSDCGLFLLGYASKMLEDDPKDFIAKIIGRQYTDQDDWSELNPSTMRADIRDQVQGLYKDQKDEERESAVKAGKLKGGKKSSPTPAPVAATKSAGAEIIDIDD